MSPSEAWTCLAASALVRLRRGQAPTRQVNLTANQTAELGLDDVLSGTLACWSLRRSRFRFAPGVLLLCTVLQGDLVAVSVAEVQGPSSNPALWMPAGAPPGQGANVAENPLSGDTPPAADGAKKSVRGMGCVTSWLQEFVVLFIRKSSVIGDRQR